MYCYLFITSLDMHMPEISLSILAEFSCVLLSLLTILYWSCSYYDLTVEGSDYIGFSRTNPEVVSSHENLG